MLVDEIAIEFQKQTEDRFNSHKRRRIDRICNSEEEEVEEEIIHTPSSVLGFHRITSSS